MDRYDNPLPISTVEKMFQSWESVVSRRESASIISLPRSDRMYRIQQFVQWTQIKKNKNLSYVPISFQSLVTEDWDVFSKKLDTYKQKGGYTVFLVTDAEWLLTSASHFISQFDSYVLSPYRSSSFLFFFETNILDDTYIPRMSPWFVFTQNILYLSMYTHDEVIHFLRHMEHMYRYSLSAIEREKIWELCGGNLRFVTEALRHTSTSHSLTFDHEDMMFRIHAFWQGLSRTEQSVLTQCIKKQPVNAEDEGVLMYFQKTGLLNIQNRSTIPIISTYVEKLFAQDHRLETRNDVIMYGETKIYDYFSVKEREILVYLLKHRGELVARDVLAERIWGENARYEYSDWNVDQLIRRLRVRLTRLGVDAGIIQTKKGKGFVCV